MDKLATGHADVVQSPSSQGQRREDETRRKSCGPCRSTKQPCRSSRQVKTEFMLPPTPGSRHGPQQLASNQASDLSILHLCTWKPRHFQANDECRARSSVLLEAAAAAAAFAGRSFRATRSQHTDRASCTSTSILLAALPSLGGNPCRDIALLGNEPREDMKRRRDQTS